MDFPLPIITRNFISKEFWRVCRRNFLKNGKQLIDFLHYLRFIYIFMKNSNGKRRFFQYPMIGVIFDAVGKRKCSQFPITNSQNLYCIFQKVMGNKLLKEIPITKYPKPIQKSFQNQSPKPIQKSFRNQNPNPIQKLILIISQGLNSKQKRTLHKHK